MKVRRTDDVEAGSNDVNDASENSNSKASLSTKLERRRRIEDLNEEKRLREELSEF